MGIEGRVALVTGSSRGIGRGVALALARAGADIAVNYRRDEESAKETVREIESMGRKCFLFQADVRDYLKVKEMVAKTIDALGKVDILVSNAGVASSGRYMADVDVEELRRLIDTHVFGAFHFIHELLPHMRQHERSDIIIISSHAAQTIPTGGGPYTIAKSALEALAKTLAREERRNGIRVNAIGPGLIDTDMGRRGVKGRDGVADIKDLYPKFPFKRVGQPYDIGNLCAFLVSKEGEYITGQVVYVAGGQ